MRTKGTPNQFGFRVYKILNAKHPKHSSPTPTHSTNHTPQSLCDGSPVARYITHQYPPSTLHFNGGFCSQGGPLPEGDDRDVHAGPADYARAYLALHMPHVPREQRGAAAAAAADGGWRMGEGAAAGDAPEPAPPQQRQYVAVLPGHEEGAPQGSYTYTEVKLDRVARHANGNASAAIWVVRTSRRPKCSLGCLGSRMIGPENPDTAPRNGGPGPCSIPGASGCRLAVREPQLLMQG